MVPPQTSEQSERARGLSVLLEVSRRLAGTLDLQRVLQAAVDGVTDVAGLDTAAVYLVDGDCLWLRATTPPLPPDFPAAARVAPLADHPHMQQAFTSRRPLLLPDVLDTDLTPEARAIVAARNLRTLLVVPLVADEATLGVFLVGSTHETAPVGEDAVELSDALANLAALAVRNAQLYREGVERARRLEQTLAERERAEAEQRRLREELVEARRLESLGRLAGGVAHDFNNMLSVILGHAELGLIAAETGGDVRDGLGQIRDAAQRSAQLTRQLLAFARRQPAAPRVLDLNATIEGLLRMLRRLIREEIELAWEPAPSLWPVRIDPVQVDQVLVNLCLNARDSITGVGRIVIRTANAPPGDGSTDQRVGAARDGSVVLSVSDTGRGMDDATRARIFEPFFTTKAPGAGTGLGLATVYGVVRQNGGTIHVDSAPGRGTTFRIRLPRCDEEADGDRGTAPEGAHREEEGVTILLVEDEPAALEMARRVLELHGHEVLAADRPSRALRIAEERCDSLRLLVTDVVMPEMSGAELARRLRRTCPGLATLFISGYTPDVVAEDEDAAHFLPKPFTVAELAAKVSAVLRHDGEGRPVTRAGRDRPR